MGVGIEGTCFARASSRCLEVPTMPTVSRLSPHTLYLPLDLAEEGQRVQRDDDVLMYSMYCGYCEEEESEIVSINPPTGRPKANGMLGAQRLSNRVVRLRWRRFVSYCTGISYTWYAGGCCNDQRPTPNNLPRTTIRVISLGPDGAGLGTRA